MGKSLASFFICIYIIWTAKEILYYFHPFSSVIALIVKYLIWIVPVFLYLIFVDRIKNPLLYMKIRDNVPTGIKWGLSIGLILAVIEGYITCSLHGRFNFELGWRWLTTFLFAFPEEVLFRGFILQKLSSSMKFTKSNLISSLMFVSIHLPIWLTSGGASLQKLFGNGLTVFLIGCVLGYLVKRTNSLWSSAIVHTIYNLWIGYTELDNSLKV